MDDRARRSLRETVPAGLIADDVIAERLRYYAGDDGPSRVLPPAEQIRRALINSGGEPLLLRKRLAEYAAREPAGPMSAQARAERSAAVRRALGGSGGEPLLLRKRLAEYASREPAGPMSAQARAERNAAVRRALRGPDEIGGALHRRILEAKFQKDFAGIDERWGPQWKHGLDHVYGRMTPADLAFYSWEARKHGRPDSDDPAVVVPGGRAETKFGAMFRQMIHDKYGGKYKVDEMRGNRALQREFEALVRQEYGITLPWWRHSIAPQSNLPGAVGADVDAWTLFGVPMVPGLERDIRLFHRYAGDIDNYGDYDDWRYQEPFGAGKFYYDGTIVREPAPWDSFSKLSPEGQRKFLEYYGLDNWPGEPSGPSLLPAPPGPAGLLPAPSGPAGLLPAPSAPAPLLPPSGPAELIPGALEPHEVRQAQSVLTHRGGRLEGQPIRDMPGIDGWLDGTPISLKRTQSGSPAAVLHHASRAERQAGRAGFANVEVFIEASNISSAALLDFVPRGGLAQIPNQGIVSAINVYTADGWVRIVPGGP